MKKLICLVFLFGCLSQTQAQQKEFEGRVVYKTTLTSKLPEVSDDAWKRYQFMADTITFLFRNGFCKESSPLRDVYYYPTEQKIYYKYKGVDSLFYADYQYDTANKVLDVSTIAESSPIKNYECKKIAVKTENGTTTYEYAPELYLNPAYDTNNTSGRYDVYIKEAKAVALKSTLEWPPFFSTKEAISVQNDVLSDSLFALPNLPKTKFDYASISKQPEFKSGMTGFGKFLQKNLNGNLGRDNINIPEGEKSASVFVKLLFIITEDGKVTNAEVLNKDDVPPALALDATSVLNKAPNFKPARLNGKKIPYIYTCSVTYVNEK